MLQGTGGRQRQRWCRLESCSGTGSWHCWAHGVSQRKGLRAATGPLSICSMGLHKWGAPGTSQQPCFQLLWPAGISSRVSPNPDWLQLGNMPCYIISTHMRLGTQIIVQISLCPSLDIRSEHWILWSNYVLDETVFPSISSVFAVLRVIDCSCALTREGQQLLICLLSVLPDLLCFRFVLSLLLFVFLFFFFFFPSSSSAGIKAGSRKCKRGKITAVYKKS